MKTYEAQRNARLVYRLMGLGMAGAVLHIGAHPDDEDIGLLAYLSHKFGVRAVYWSATRGEGGQNRIGPYRDEALGIYRTWESMAARATDGGESLFGPFFDFGYSKNAEDAFTKWGREALIREVVRAIRLVQPHIIVLRWTGTPNDLHGQHQAVGQACLEAFEAAGDPHQFPELKKQGLAAWQPSKFYQSMDNSGGDLTAGGALNFLGRLNRTLEKEGVLRINTGEFDPIAGRTYQERAWVAYNEHKTQAMGLVPAAGDFFYYFALHKSLVPVPKKEITFFDGLDPSLSGLADYPGNGSPFLRCKLEEIEVRATEALQKFRVNDPMEAASPLFEALPLLREMRKVLTTLDSDKEESQTLDAYLTRKIVDFEEVIATCLGFDLECISEHSRVIPGQRFHVTARLWNHRGKQIDKVAFTPSLPEGWQARSLEPEGDGGNSKNFEITTGETALLTCPYWLTKAKESYAYQWPEGEPSSRPFGPPQVEINCEVHLGQHQIVLRKGVICRERFPGGFRELPLAVIPPVSLHPKTDKEFLEVKEEEQHLKVQVTVYNNSDQPVAGVLELIVPTGWKVAPSKTDVTLTEAKETKTVLHVVTIPAGTLPGRYTLHYKMRCGNRDYAVIVNPVRMGTPGLSAQAEESNCLKEEFIITPSQVKVHLINVRFMQKLRYAYVQGAQEEVLEALKPFNIHFHMMADAEMGYLDLSRFDAVVIGPNAYLIREELRKYASRFLEYVKQGGTLIVQYQGYLYQTPGFAPYPFQYKQPHDRVTHENAPVRILDPDHTLFHFSNTINRDDFNDWVRDRGLYFFNRWDKRYHALLSCSDPGEEPLEGGLIECQYGRGTFLYTGYSFFRQLPVGVAGAFRLFANILAIPEARILERIEFLKKVALFSLLTEQQLDSVARIMSERWVEDGTYICRQGEFGDELYIVYRGRVDVIREVNKKKESIFLAREGDCLGEMAVLGNIPRTASLCARGDVDLLVIEGFHFQSLLRQNPDMSIHVIKLLVNRLAPAGG